MENIHTRATTENYAHELAEYLAITLANERNLYIRNITFRWMDASTVNEKKMILMDIELETQTKPNMKTYYADDNGRQR